MKCGYCGTELPATALFCGECGRSLVQAAAVAGRGAAASAANVTDTAVIDKVELFLDAPVPQPEPQPEPEPEPESEPTSVGEQAAVAESAETAEAALHTTPEPVRTAVDPERDANPTLGAEPDVDADTDATRLVAQESSAQRFVLQFSTGESVTVFGTGLIGRNPAPEPAEYFDQLVVIVDPGKSVSKTHLEFGQSEGAFWIADRYSGNGSIVREPDTAPHRCDPGKRYRLVRGTRVSIGEQFFVVS